MARTRFLLSMGPIIDPRPAGLSSRRYHSTSPPFARRNHLVAPLGRHASRSSPGIKSRHLTRSTHGTPTLPAKFAEEDVAPHLHEDECWSATRGAGGDEVSTMKALVPQQARRLTNRSRAPLSIDTKLLCKFDRVHLTRRFCPRDARSWRQMPVALKQPS